LLRNYRSVGNLAPRVSSSREQNRKTRTVPVLACLLQSTAFASNTNQGMNSGCSVRAAGHAPAPLLDNIRSLASWRQRSAGKDGGLHGASDLTDASSRLRAMRTWGCSSWRPSAIPASRRRRSTGRRRTLCVSARGAFTESRLAVAARRGRGASPRWTGQRGRAGSRPRRPRRSRPG
jgi:hypothetical protein